LFPKRLPDGFGTVVGFPNKLPLGLSFSFIESAPIVGSDPVTKLNPPPVVTGLASPDPDGGALLLIVTIFLLEIAS
jgi:hypothetical protein